MKSINLELGNNVSEIKIIPLGDFHIGDEFFKINDLKKVLKYVEKTENCYLILNGDLMNNALKSSKSDSYREKKSIEEQQDELIKLLWPVRNKILYMCQGNHEYRTSLLAGIDPLRYVAKVLGLLDSDRYSDNSYIINLMFGKNKSPTALNQYIIYGIHGAGSGGRRMGATINAMENLTKICPNADLYIHSHTHVPLSYTDKCYLYNRHRHKIEEFTRTFVNTNSFLNYGGYAERFGYKMCDQAPLMITVKFKCINGAIRPISQVLKFDI